MKRVVNVVQRYNSGQIKANETYVYEVVSLKNITDPKIGDYLTQSQVSQLIVNQTEVNIKGVK